MVGHRSGRADRLRQEGEVSAIAGIVVVSRYAHPGSALKGGLPGCGLFDQRRCIEGEALTALSDVALAQQASPCPSRQTRHPGGIRSRSCRMGRSGPRRSRTVPGRHRMT